MSQMSQWVNESMSQIWKNKSFGRNNKIKHYFYLKCLLQFIAACTCKAYFWHEISTWAVCYQALSLRTTCMPREIALPDTLQEPFKQSDNISVLLEFPYQKWSAAPRLFILVDARVLKRRANVNKHKHNANNECPKILINQQALKAT